jgi:PAS domain S-box-containing protein
MRLKHFRLIAVTFPIGYLFLVHVADILVLRSIVTNAVVRTSVIFALLIAGLLPFAFWIYLVIRRLEARVAERDRVLHTILSASPDPTCLCDPNGRFRYANPAALQVLKMDEGQLVGRTWQELELPVDLTESIDQQWQALLSSGQTFIGEASFPDPTGLREYEYTTTPVLNAAMQIEGVVVTARDITARKQLEKHLHESNERLEAKVAARTKEIRRQSRRVAARILQVQEEERRRLARELHDEMGQTLSMLLIEVQRTRAAAGAERSDLAAGFDMIRYLAQQALDSTRTLAHRLRPPLLDDIGLVSALRSLARDHNRIYGMTCAIETSGLPDERLSSEIETALFRIAQEALTNSAKHAAATRIRLALSCHDGIVTLCIEDDGCGLPPHVMTEEWASGLGLVGMRERARLVGGQLQIETEPGHGTKILATVPFTPAMPRTVGAMPWA